MNFGGDRTPQCTASYAGYSTPRGLVWDTNMAAISLFWDTNMAAVTSCEKTLYVCDVGHAAQRSVQKSTIKTRTLSSAQKTKKHTCSCLIVMRSCQSKKKNRKPRHRQCSTELQSHSVLQLFELSRRLSVYLSSATPRISWELKTKNTLKTRLRVVPHFSSGIVERAKRERTWKSPHARKASHGGEREKWGTTDKAQAFDPSRLTDFGVWSSYPIPNQRIQWDSFPPWAVIALVIGKLRGIFIVSKRTP